MLDLRLPTIVITGTWNPAIFQPGWIAEHLFGVPKGQQLEMVQRITTAPQPKVTYYHASVGISLTPERLELYCNDLSDETKAKTEDAARRAIEVLLHTPIGAFGVNFKFTDDVPDPALFDKMKTYENIEETYAVGDQTFTSMILLEPGIHLRLARGVADNQIWFGFNYHHAHTDRASNPFSGAIDKYFGLSRDLLASVYEVHGFSVRSHELPTEQREAR